MHTDDEEFAGHTPEPWELDRIHYGPNDEILNSETYHFIEAGNVFPQFGFHISGILTPIDAALIHAAPRLLRERNAARKALAESEAMRQREGAAGYGCVKEMELTTAALVEARARVAELESSLRKYDMWETE